MIYGWGGFYGKVRGEVSKEYLKAYDVWLLL